MWHRRDRLGHAGHAVEDLENPLGAGGGPLRGGDHPAHRIEPGVEAADVSQERRQHADRDMRRDATRQAPNAQTTSRPTSVSSVTIGPKNDQVRSRDRWPRTR